MIRTVSFLVVTLVSPAFLAPTVRAAAVAQAAPTRLEPLVAGVSEIAAPGVPGTLAVWGERAFPVVVAKADGGGMAPVVAAGVYRRGRVVAFGHTGYAGKEALAFANTKELMLNAARWAGRDAAVRVLTNSDELDGVLKGAGVASSSAQDWHTKLGSGGPADPTVVIVTGSFDDERIAPLAKYVSSGGGLILCETGWGWKQGAKGKPMTAFAANKVMAPAGIAFTDDTAGRTSEKGFDVKGHPATELCHAMSAVEVLARGGSSDTSRALHTAMGAVRVLPVDDRQLRPRLDDLLSTRRDGLVPTEERPLGAKDALSKLLLAYEFEKVATLPVELVKASPAAKDFPGAPLEARPIQLMLDIKLSENGRYSTGLYARPGEVVTFSVGARFINSGVGVRIGCHSDTLWEKEEWKRAPEISRWYEFDEGLVRVASPFGGLIYVEKVSDDGKEWPVLRMRVERAIPAPAFVRGKTRLEDWTTTIRQQPAPWAELISSKVIVSVPSETIRGLDDPEAVLKVWDEILDAQADLAAIPRERKRPERIVADRQISAGYMHAGYPIMTHLDAAPAMVSAEKLKEGQWGLFHELGHNHQNPDWTFDGTVEVTCNLFSLYTMEKVCGKAFGEGHDALKDWKQKAAKHVKDGAKFEEWKKDPFLALTMYMQLVEAFGWDTYKKVFAEYNGLKKDERPKTDDEKRDQWMVRFSKACGKNLGPFFEAWKVPTSTAARDSIKDLGAWMPEGFGAK